MQVSAFSVDIGMLGCNDLGDEWTSSAILENRENREKAEKGWTREVQNKYGLRLICLHHLEI